MFLLFREVERQPGVDAESNDEHGLDGVDDEDEVEGVLVLHTIKDEHGFYGKVPGTCTVGGGDDNGDRTDDEGTPRFSVKSKQKNVR